MFYYNNKQLDYFQRGSRNDQDRLAASRSSVADVVRPVRPLVFKFYFHPTGDFATATLLTLLSSLLSACRTWTEFSSCCSCRSQIYHRVAHAETHTIQQQGKRLVATTSARTLKAALSLEPLLLRSLFATHVTWYAVIVERPKTERSPRKIRFQFLSSNKNHDHDCFLYN